ncbi:RDD family protein [Gammaproteobacteria bacterium AB-CW1]|uniref:RDD family protein n=1 Tax=Natronospira elongata TaxID=3110268 RepID=A0AAP6JGM5_9GAMM|nr:RDD family protein [Gammaproteobacteria bacterium AB-CW1]
MEIDKQRPASLLRRLGAALYDGLLVLAIWFIATLVALPFAGEEAFEPENPMLLAYLILVTGLFFIWFWQRSGQTLGMRAWRLRLVNGQGHHPPLWRLIMRAGLMLLLLILALYGLAFLTQDFWPDWLGALMLMPLCISMAWVLVDEERRSLHDIAAGTRLIFLPKQEGSH